METAFVSHDCFAATALLTGTAFAHDPALHSKEDDQGQARHLPTTQRPGTLRNRLEG